MTDPFMLDQKVVEVSLTQLQGSCTAWRRLRGAHGGGGWTEAMEYQLQGLDGTIRNGIRDAKWSLAELEETLRLLTEHGGRCTESEDLNSRRAFLETARDTLAKLELEVLLPPQQSQADGVANDESSDEASDSASQERPCVGQGLQAIDSERSKARRSGKSVFWHRHVQSSSDGVEVPVVDKAACWLSAKPKLRRFPALLIKYRLWISVAVAMALLVLVVIVISVSKANRVQASLAAAATTGAPTPPK